MTVVVGDGDRVDRGKECDMLDMMTCTQCLIILMTASPALLDSDRDQIKDAPIEGRRVGHVYEGMSSNGGCCSGVCQGVSQLRCLLDILETLRDFIISSHFW